VPPLHNLSARGPHDPVASTPARAPRSIRRTSSIDTTRPDGVTGRMVMEGRARDVLTTPDGAGVTLGEAEVVAGADGASRELALIRTVPDAPALQQLLGAVVGPGFRARVDDVVPEERERQSLLYLLLDDLPGAGLVSGYSMLHADAVPRSRPDEYLGARSDMCAGWAHDGSMMVMLREHGQNPTPLGPPAPELARADDDMGWHALADLPPHGMRRIRRIDVIAPSGDAGSHHLDVFFRDSHVDDHGAETVVHEYSVVADVDEATRTVLDIEANADVLPWMECPAAVGSATRLIGHGLDDLRPWVRETFVGTSTCTHLNDVLRGLTDVNVLLDQLGPVTTNRGA
jgi:hypothetical protein